MSKQAKFWLGVALSLSLAAPALADTAATTTDAKAPTADTVVATVNGTDITLGSMIALRDQLPAQYKQLPDDVLFKGILDQLVQQELLAQSAKGKLTKKDKIALANSERAFIASTMLNRVEKAAITEDALKKAYDAKYADFKPDTEYHAAHILVKTEKEAEDLKAKIDGGADFAKLAEADSKDPGSAKRGGDLGWFGKGMMVKPFEDAVTKMKPGEVVGPIKTQFGWHLIKLMDTRPTKPPKLDAVRGELSKKIGQEAVAAELAKLKDGAKITENDKGIDPAVLKDQTLLKD
ncbi:peptidylprolyl isomerase [Acidimangrovimonas pyrenivorans]|uniref:Parvulin-like PPIase n=1 Tax=Acidimangrovimonas pyrenivorans TaxID=2030798 RepID=A0ABV7ADI5_9RHOB